MISSEPQNFKPLKDDFTTISERNPTDIEAFFNQGMAYYYAGDYKQAIRYLDKVIELEPDYTVAYLSRAVAYKGLGDYDQYLKNYKTAARLGCKGARATLKSRGMQESFCKRMSEQIKKRLKK